MKCVHCGNNLNIEDEICPSCNQPNPHAIQHRKDMKHFREDYHHTKKMVFQRNRDTVSMMAKITIITILSALCLVVFWATSNTYRIHSWAERNQINKKSRIHTENMERLEAERDFFGLTAYYDNNGLYQSDEFDHFRTIQFVSSVYYYIYSNMFQLYNQSGEYDANKERWIQIIGDNLEMMYNRMEPNEYLQEQYSEEHMEAMAYLKEEIEALLHVYLKIPREEIEMFPGLSSAKMQIIIERSVEPLENK